MVAVIGGPQVYSLFLRLGYDVFHLSRVADVDLPGGLRLFLRERFDGEPDACLAAAGLTPGKTVPLGGGVTLTDWRQSVLQRSRVGLEPLPPCGGGKGGGLALPFRLAALQISSPAATDHTRVENSATPDPVPPPLWAQGGRGQGVDKAGTQSTCAGSSTL